MRDQLKTHYFVWQVQLMNFLETSSYPLIQTIWAHSLALIEVRKMFVNNVCIHETDHSVPQIGSPINLPRKKLSNLSQTLFGTYQQCMFLIYIHLVYESRVLTINLTRRQSYCFARIFKFSTLMCYIRNCLIDLTGNSILLNCLPDLLHLWAQMRRVHFLLLTWAHCIR